MDNDDYRVFKAFTDAFHESISSMTGLSIKRLSPDDVPAREGKSFLTTTGFKGDVSGCCMLISPADAVLRLYESYLGEKPPGFDESVLDAMKELSGIINGAASAKEQEFKLQFTPSVTFLVDNLRTHVAAKSTGLAVSYLVDQCGVFTIEVHQGKSA